MAHKYLNKIGVKSNNPCIFNTKEYNKKRNDKFKKQRKKYGFDERETWDLGYTSATWLYEHLKVFKKVNIVDLNYHKFNIPVLYEIQENEINGNDINRKYTREEIEEHTQEEAIDFMIEYLKRCLAENNKNNQWNTLRNAFEEDKKLYEYLKGAFNIYAKVVGAMWW